MTDQPFDLDLPGLSRRARSTGRTYSVRLTRLFPTSCEDLWAACTEPESLARWIGELRGDPADGAVELRMHEDVVRCEILRCDPPRRLQLLWNAPGEDRSVIDVNLTESADGALLSIEHLALTDRSGIAYGAGWEEFLVDLGEYLEDRSERAHDCESVERAAQLLWDGVEIENDDRFGRFDVDGRTFVARRGYAAPRSTVWRAITTSAGLSTWFGVTSGQLAVGGEWRVEFDDGAMVGQVEHCVPEQSFTTTYRQDGFDLVHRVEVRLTDVDGRCLSELRQSVADGTSDRLSDGLAAGWVAHMSTLDHLLADESDPDRYWSGDFTIAAGVHQRPSVRS